MTATLPSSPPASADARVASRQKKKRTARLSDHIVGEARDVLGQYVDHAGRAHELVACPGAGGSVLVVDRDAVTLGQRRLVAHLACDEPAENARLVCEHYLADDRGRWCRPVIGEDLTIVPYFQEIDSDLPPEPDALPDGDVVADRHGRTYQAQLISTRASIPEMRWLQYPPGGQLGPVRVLSTREVIAAVESYEPIRTLTQGVVTAYRQNPEVSVSVLRGEIQRLCASRIVLNRRLRETVLKIAQAEGLSLSEIAMRCGRVKYDSRGNVSGETSWLSRRLGLAPEGGETSPTPWVHSDVLALIARRGLGISPREVELT